MSKTCVLLKPACQPRSWSRCCGLSGIGVKGLLFPPGLQFRVADCGDTWNHSTTAHKSLLGQSIQSGQSKDARKPCGSCETIRYVRNPSNSTPTISTTSKLVKPPNFFDRVSPSGTVELKAAEPPGPSGSRAPLERELDLWSMPKNS